MEYNTHRPPAPSAAANRSWALNLEPVMDELHPPFLSAVEKARHVLIAGAGGGFDIFCGLPLYFALREQGKQVTLANLSFSKLHLIEERVTDQLVRVTAASSGSKRYFPEQYLCEWFKNEGEEASIYAIERAGVIPLREGYQKLIDDLQIDALVLVDGGTDSLMRGDEAGLGTPHEDVASLVAGSELRVDQSFLLCLGFGIDAFHGVCHAHFLEAVAELTKANAFLGTFSLLPAMRASQRFRAASEYVFSKMPEFVSIVTSSVLSAIEGQYGDHHMTSRTHGSTLWINPLMSIYWCFELKAVAERLLYDPAIRQTQTFDDVVQIIDRHTLTRESVREYFEFPL